MSAAYSSERVTGDVDFSVIMPVQPYANQLRDVLDKALMLAAEELGYADLVLKVQRITPHPKKENFETAANPALEVTIGSARRDTPEMDTLDKGNANQVLRIDMSFNEPALNVEAISIDKDGSTILAYGIEDLIAEKLRALLQQPIRNRNRRQDVYDIHWLATKFAVTDAQKKRVLEALKAKADSRDIEARAESLDDPEIARRANIEWKSMKLEVSELIPFDEAFAVVYKFYRSLPW